MPDTGIKDIVREKYGEAARRAAAGEKACCGPTCCDASAAIVSARDPITANLYEAHETLGLPSAAVQASLGCGNPTALASSTRGRRFSTSARAAGSTCFSRRGASERAGKVYGLDMTDECSRWPGRTRKAGVGERRIPEGRVESIPLPDDSVDVIISNCVINLSADKDRVLREAFRVLKPGGRFAVSDVVVRGEVPAEVRQTSSSGSAASRALSRRWTIEAKLTDGRFRASRSPRRGIYDVEKRRSISWRRGSTRTPSAGDGREVHERVRAGDETGRLRRVMGAFERFLSVWVALCMAAGVALGTLFPGAVAALRSLELGQGSQVNAAIMVLIWLMVAPMMARIDFPAIRNVGKGASRARRYALRELARETVFDGPSRAGSSSGTCSRRGSRRPQADQYIAGSDHPRGRAVHGDGLRLERAHAGGDPAYTLVQVALNDLLMLVPFSCRSSRILVDRGLVARGARCAFFVTSVVASSSSFPSSPGGDAAGPEGDRAARERPGSRARYLPRLAPVTVGALLPDARRRSSRSRPTTSSDEPAARRS